MSEADKQPKVILKRDGTVAEGGSISEQNFAETTSRLNRSSMFKRGPKGTTTSANRYPKRRAPSY